MKRKVSLAIILSIIVVAGAGIGYYYWFQGSHYVKTEDARIAGDAFKVSPKVAGEINEIYVEEGDVVQENQTIVEETTFGASSDGLIRSPIKGTVIKIFGKEKELASPGQPVALVMDMKDLYISANIEETDIQKIKPGQEVEITIDMLGGKKLIGKVNKIGQATNSMFSLLPAVNTSGNFNKVTQLIPIEISFAKPKDLELIPGTNVEVKISIKS